MYQTSLKTPTQTATKRRRLASRQPRQVNRQTPKAPTKVTRSATPTTTLCPTCGQDTTPSQAPVLKTALKACRVCNAAYPETTYYYYRASHPGRYQATCRWCAALAQRRLQRDRALAQGRTYRIQHRSNSLPAKPASFLSRLVIPPTIPMETAPRVQEAQPEGQYAALSTRPSLLQRLFYGPTGRR
jgi:hypothetical protein